MRRSASFSTRPRRFGVRPGWDDSLGSQIAYGVPQVVGVVSLVGDHGIWLEAVQQFVAAGDVMALPRPEQQAHRVAQRVGGCVGTVNLLD